MGRAATNSKLTPAEKKAWQSELTKICSMFAGRRTNYKDGDLNESVLDWYKRYLALMAQKKTIAEVLAK